MSTSSLRSTRGGALALLTLLLGLFVVAVPSAAHADETGSSQALPPGKAWVRVGHFVPGMGATTIELDPLTDSGPTMSLARGATYGAVSKYEQLAPGSYKATVRESSAAAGAAPLLSRSFEITAGAARTVAVLGTADAPRLALLTDDLTTPAPGTARVRLLSASDAADSVTVSAVDGPVIAEDTVLGQTTDYTTVPAGSWTLRLTSSSSAGTSLQEVPIASGSVYTVVALDSSADGLKLRVVTDAAGAAMAPMGGAKTGGGGTAATAGATDATALPLLGGLLALVGVGAVALRRRTATAT